MSVGTKKMRIKGHIKYLGVTLDTKQSFWHIKVMAERAATKTNSLSRLMANTYGLRQEKRRLLMLTTLSALDHVIRGGK